MHTTSLLKLSCSYKPRRDVSELESSGDGMLPEKYPLVAVQTLLFRCRAGKQQGKRRFCDQVLQVRLFYRFSSVIYVADCAGVRHREVHYDTTWPI
eukprot:scaffold209436_cov24-Prasinocladus_malaysianus.AAC.1